MITNALKALNNTVSFLIGPMSPTLTTAVCFCLASSVARIVQQGLIWDTLTKISKRILSYFIFLLVANRMDAMGLNMLLGWQGNTQLLVAAWIAINELKNIFLLVKQFGEIEPPAIITERMDHLQMGQINKSAGYVDSESLDEQIKLLKANMDQLKALAQLQIQTTAAVNQATTAVNPAAADMP
ncbi:MAG: hypothetical protein PHO29_13410, partial [Acetobacterium sp.]|nr:hypothetical protein [Acetobacterium sp.]